MLLYYLDVTHPFARSSEAVQKKYLRETDRTPKFWIKMGGFRGGDHRIFTVGSIFSCFMVVSQVALDTIYKVKPSIPCHFSVGAKTTYIKNQYTLISKVKYFRFISEFHNSL